MGVLSSLTNRIFLASAALTMVCMGIAIYLVNVRVTASAEEELRHGLVQTGATVDQQRATLSDVFTVQARLVADLPKLKAAVDTGDVPTVTPVAEEYQRQLGSDLFLVTDRAGRVLASIPGAPPAVPPAALPTIREAQAGREGTAFWVAPEGILQVVSVPIAVGTPPQDVLGTLSVGFLLGNALAARLKALTGSEIVFAAGGQVLAATLPDPSRAAVVPLIGTAGVSRVSVGGSEYVALTQPLAPPRSASLLGGTRGAPVPDQVQRAGETAPVAIILRSRTERLRFLRPIQGALGLTGLLAVLLATGISYAVARTITRPLGAITATMREMAATGDLARKIDWRARRWEDEDARLLAGTFNTLTDSIARFQREAADRERLSALGRLSTIIAHEVRNPLMIIKAALRPLEREPVSADDLRAAVADIHDEVTRLNRLVNEVLDFARPLRFELGEVDVNRLCEEAAAAATAGQAGPPVHLELDGSLPLAVTDGERLRTVLVNVLLNALHAVQARVAGATPPPERDVELETTPLPGGRFVITVRDRGVGVSPEELARVFEPFFTTKRTGTGLGLAISRNIVEGLGGAISVASRAGAGTTVRIELPPRAPDNHAGSV